MCRIVVYLASVLACWCGASRQTSFTYAQDCGRHQGSTCQLLGQCPQYRARILQHGLSQRLAKELRALNCGYKDRMPLICCKVSGTSTPASENSSVAIAYPSAEHINLRLLPSNCEEYYGNRITGGKTAELNEFPWMVQLLYSTPDDKTELTHQCGGTLINERYVLTAAHCILFNGRRSLQKVALGEHDIRRNPDCQPDAPDKCYYVQKMTVYKENVVVHNSYSKNDKKRRNDIALIRLPQSVDTSLSNVIPICLPTTASLQNRDLTGVYAIAAGWGVTDSEFGSSALASVLQHASLPIISGNQCTTDLYHNKESIEDSQLCTGTLQKSRYMINEDEVRMDVCPGDSGGPLMGPITVDNSVRLIQWGIISFGGRRCATGMPSVYTRVTSYMNWILDNIRE